MPDRSLLAVKSHSEGSAIIIQSEASKGHPTNGRIGDRPRMMTRATRGVEITERGHGGGLHRIVCLLLHAGNVRAMPNVTPRQAIINARSPGVVPARNGER